MAKEAIHLSSLMQALTLVLPEALTIECNNGQTTLVEARSTMQVDPHLLGTNQRDGGRRPEKSALKHPET